LYSAIKSEDTDASCLRYLYLESQRLQRNGAMSLTDEDGGLRFRFALLTDRKLDFRKHVGRRIENIVHITLKFQVHGACFHGGEERKTIRKKK